MKRILAAVSFAVVATPVLATPFEQTQLDRGITSYVQAEGASAGSTNVSGNLWAQDHNFAAPAK